MIMIEPRITTQFDVIYVHRTLQHTPPPPSETCAFPQAHCDEQNTFLYQLSPLEQWAAPTDFSSISEAQLVQYVDIIVQQISIVFHRITRPNIQHKETKLEKQYKALLNTLSDNTASRKRTLSKLQELNEQWTKKISARQKKQLHHSMVKGSKIKKAVENALNPSRKSPIQLWDKSSDPPRLATDPSHVGQVFSDCLSKLGGDPDFTASEDTLSQYISLIPKCPPSSKNQELPLPTLEWLNSVSHKAPPSKATGEDEMNYYIVSLLPDALQLLLLRAIHCILLHAPRPPPPSWSKARVCLLFKKGDTREPTNYRPICLIQTLVKFTAVWQCQQLTRVTKTHGLLHLCQHGGLQHHRCGDHMYDVVSRALLSKGRLYHLYIDFNKAFNSVPLAALWRV